MLYIECVYKSSMKGRLEQLTVVFKHEYSIKMFG